MLPRSLLLVRAGAPSHSLSQLWLHAQSTCPPYFPASLICSDSTPNRRTFATSPYRSKPEQPNRRSRKPLLPRSPTNTITNGEAIIIKERQKGSKTKAPIIKRPKNESTWEKKRQRNANSKEATTKKCAPTQPAQVREKHEKGPPDYIYVKPHWRRRPSRRAVQRSANTTPQRHESATRLKGGRRQHEVCEPEYCLTGSRTYYEKDERGHEQWKSD